MQSHITEACSAVGSSFLLGAGNDGRRPEEIFKFRLSEMPFYWTLGEVLTEF